MTWFPPHHNNNSTLPSSEASIASPHPYSLTFAMPSTMVSSGCVFFAFFWTNMIHMPMSTAIALYVSLALMVLLPFLFVAVLGLRLRYHSFALHIVRFPSIFWSRVTKYVVSFLLTAIAAVSVSVGMAVLVDQLRQIRHKQIDDVWRFGPLHRSDRSNHMN